VTAKAHGRCPCGARGYGAKVERRDVYQDDLTQERQPTPGDREDVASTEALDPDASADGENQQQPIPESQH
jgi:hypothetical protein